MSALSVGAAILAVILAILLAFAWFVATFPIAGMIGFGVIVTILYGHLACMLGRDVLDWWKARRGGRR